MKKYMKKQKLSKDFIYITKFQFYGSNLPKYLNYEKYKRLLRLLNKKTMYRKLINKIGVDWKKIPEDIINFSTIYNSSRNMLLKNWLETNNVPIEKRTKRFVMNFFNKK